jgi:large subunit ribosomal protein L15
LHKHKWSWTVKFEPDHFGRDPFKPPRRERPSRWMNVGELDSLLPRGRGEKKPAELDLAAMGIGKLLGSGIVGGPIVVRVDSFTKRAQAKIEGAGGKILQPEADQ